MSEEDVFVQMFCPGHDLTVQVCAAVGLKQST